MPLKNDKAPDLYHILLQLQKENIDLRSRLAGVTPKNVATAANIEKCQGCRDLNRQKSHQATYLEEKVVAARQRAIEYEKHCKQLRTEMTELKSMLAEINNKYQVRSFLWIFLCLMINR